jgi:hypothetical protein
MANRVYTRVGNFIQSINPFATTRNEAKEEILQILEKHQPAETTNAEQVEVK